MFSICEIHMRGSDSLVEVARRNGYEVAHYTALYLC